MIFFERDKFFAFLQLKAITLSVISIFKTLTQMKQQCHQDSTPLVFIRYKATQKAMDTLRYFTVHAGLTLIKPTLTQIRFNESEDG